MDDAERFTSRVFGTAVKTNYDLTTLTYNRGLYVDKVASFGRQVMVFTTEKRPTMTVRGGVGPKKRFLTKIHNFISSKDEDWKRMFNYTQYNHTLIAVRLPEDDMLVSWMKRVAKGTPHRKTKLVPEFRYQSSRWSKTIYWLVTPTEVRGVYDLIGTFKRKKDAQRHAMDDGIILHSFLVNCNAVYRHVSTRPVEDLWGIEETVK